MRHPRVAVSVALIAVLASVVSPGIAGALRPSRPSDPPSGAFRSVTADLAPGPTMAPLPADPRADARAALDGAQRIADPPGSVSLLQRIDQPDPTPEVAAVPVATPKPTAAPALPVVSAWTHDPDVSWYGPGFYGQRTACGETLTTELIGVANRTLPCGTLVAFRNPANGIVVVAPVVDRGPYVSGRQWDLTGGLCVALDHCYTGPLDYRIQ